jgi:hypothetical protein
MFSYLNLYGCKRLQCINDFTVGVFFSYVEFILVKFAEETIDMTVL